MSFIGELKRRNVIRVGIAYVLVSWVLLQAADFAFDLIGAPNWVIQSLSLLVAMGLPVVLIFSWVYEMTPEGLKREKEIDRTQSVTSNTGRKLDRVIIFLLVLAVAVLLAERFLNPFESPQPTAAATTAQETPAVTPQETPDEPAADTRQSVAVLPFVAMSNGPDDGYFADGLTEEILNSLAQLPELLVTARTSAFAFKNEELTVQEIATRLGVDHIVEGSVRRSGDRLRVTAQLIRASDGFHLWSNNYDSSSADTIAVQEDIAEKIAVALNVVLDGVKRELMQVRGLRNVEAFIAFQKGLELFEKAHRGSGTVSEDMVTANGFFEDVLAQVPEFSTAWSLHSDLYMHEVLEDMNKPTGEPANPEIMQVFETGRTDFKKAIRFARTSGERASIELDLAYLTGNWRGITDRLEKFLEQQDCYGGLWFEPLALPFGYAGRLMPILEELVACDPLTAANWEELASARLWQQDADGVIEATRHAMSFLDDDSLVSLLSLGLLLKGETGQAQYEMETRIKSVEDSMMHVVMIAAALGQREKAGALFDQYQGLPTAHRFNTLAMYAWMGERESANALAAELDQHPFGHLSLSIAVVHCMCGEPWDLSVTPVFAGKIAESGLVWPPLSPFEFPFKDW